MCTTGGITSATPGLGKATHCLRLYAPITGASMGIIYTVGYVASKIPSYFSNDDVVFSSMFELRMHSTKS